jgi:hypothetical protein
MTPGRVKTLGEGLANIGLAGIKVHRHMSDDIGIDTWADIPKV